MRRTHSSNPTLSLSFTPAIYLFAITSSLVLYLSLSLSSTLNRAEQSPASLLPILLPPSSPFLIISQPQVFASSLVSLKFSPFLRSEGIVSEKQRALAERSKEKKIEEKGSSQRWRVGLVMMMVMGKEDLGLSLGLSSSNSLSASSSSSVSAFPPQLSLMPSSSSSSSSSSSLCLQPLSFASLHPHQKAPWSDLLFQHSEKRLLLGAEENGRPFSRGIDVNRAPSAAVSGGGAERDVSGEDAPASSPNSAVSILSASKRSAELDATFHHTGGHAAAAAAAGDEHEGERASSRGISDEEDGESSRKKLRLSKDQAAVLEESFKEHNTLNPKQKLTLAKQLNLRARQVEVWFQNRRARTKLKQTEVDCEFLKRCCENLTEENRRLQKEVQELRALKLSPQFYMHMTPPTTLTMCPSCERVSNSTAAGPWAPIPLRSSFLDAAPQRS